MSEIPTIIDEIISKRKANASAPQQILGKLKSLELKIQQFRELQQNIKTSSNDTLHAAFNINQFDFKILSARITQQREIWELLLQRLNRDTINIGVIGLARQGKSTLLQKVTGLTDDEIPSSDRMPCTSVQSNIYHFDGDTEGKVYFHSESSFLEQVIHPYYQELGFPNFPKSLNEFRNSPFPPPSVNHRHPAKAEAIYKHLKEDYYANFGGYSPLLQPLKSSITIPKNEIKRYVSQDYDEVGNPKYFNHLAVEKVEIYCSFPEAKVKKIGLVDMPGLGDTRLGDTERMIKALAQDVDFVLFVRRPKQGGDLWGKNTDIPLYDDASQALQNRLPLSQWSFMFLNYDGGNEKQCNDLENTRVNNGIHVKKCLRGNCTSSEDANLILREVLNELGENMLSLDRQYMSASFEDLEKFQAYIKEKIQGLQYAIEGLGDIDGQYINLRNQLIKELFSQIEEFRDNVREKFIKPNEEFNKKVSVVIEKCKKEISIPNQKDIDVLAKTSAGGLSGAYFEFIQAMRASFLKQFHSVEGEMRQSFEQTKTELSSIFIDNGLGQLDDLSTKKGSDFFRALSDSIKRINGINNLAIGFDFIASFEVTYKGFIQRQIWQKLSDVFPPFTQKPVELESSNSAFPNLQKMHQKAITECETGLKNLGESINGVQISMVEEFADHVKCTMDIRQEWDNFLIKNRCQIWPQLQELEKQKILQQQWLNLVNETFDICQRLNVIS